MSEGGKDTALVLVVDDERDILELVTLRLEQAGYAVEKAEDGEEALRIMQERAPDLVVLDVQMPGADGYEVTRRIRADAELADTPVLLLSASVHEEEIKRGLEAGADDYLLKPFDQAELRARVAALLRGAPPEPG